MNKALFLDRDGVINKEINYLYKSEDVEFVDGIFEICNKAKELGYLIIIITNQAGIARGYYSNEDFEKINEWFQNEFLKRGVKIDATYYCPHHPDFTGNCSCRKPEPGMIFDAQKEFDIDLNNSILIGDKESDIEAGGNAGVGKCVKILPNQLSVKKIIAEICHLKC